ncbi:MAG: hypothetical protein K2K55_06265, partial [Duncaniella sp.]|nr:hypothetical protein [Duncaniella sp.]
MRTLCSLLIILLSTIITSRAADALPASWTLLPVYGDISSIAETKDKVYFVSGGSLYHYDKEYGETRYYVPGTDLSDHKATALYADPFRNRVVVVYDNSNIDILYSDGRRVNLGDIKNASIDEEKGITDIAFDPKQDRIFVATQFGLVKFSPERAEVIESGVYHHPVTSLMVTPDHIYLATPGNSSEATTFYSLPIDKSINNFKNFSQTGSLWGTPDHWYPLDESATRFGGLVYGNQLRAAIASSEGALSFQRRDPVGSQLVPTYRDGLLLIGDDGLVYSISPDASVTTTVNTSVAEFSGQKITALGGLSSVWMADRSGIGRYSISPEGNVKVLSDRYKPSPATSFKEICSLFPTADGMGLIAMNLGATQTHPVGKGANSDTRMGCDIITPGSDEIVTIMPENVEVVTSPGRDAVRKGGAYIYAPSFAAQSPFDPATFFIGTTQEGIYVVRDNEVVAKWDADAGIHKYINYQFEVPYGCFDSEGNLWIAVFNADTSVPTIRILPAAKVKGDPAAVKASDW